MVYEINYAKWAMNSRTKLCAEYVDSKSEVGNKNGKIDTDKERSLFTKMIKSAYNYDYDFNKDPELQDGELKANNDGFFDPLNELGSGNLGGYTNSNLAFVGNDCGRSAGRQTAIDLIGYTTSEDSQRVQNNLNRILEDYTPELNNKLIKNFVQGYYQEKGWFGDDLFKQLATENDSSKITNRQAAQMMKRIMEAAEDKRDSNEYKIVENAYNNIVAENQDGLFSTQFKNLDKAVKKLMEV